MYIYIAYIHMLYIHMRGVVCLGESVDRREEKTVMSKTEWSIE
jgi:hypothetical protein